MDRVDQAIADLKAYFEGRPKVVWTPEMVARLKSPKPVERLRRFVEELNRAPAAGPALPDVPPEPPPPEPASPPDPLPAPRDSSPAETAAAATIAMTLREYQAVAALLPRPSSEQMQSFAAFVCGAHSWYKHLPLLPPGRRLQFYLDPAAGMQLSFQGGRVTATPRAETGFHYSWISTVEYRRRFGYLAFSQPSGTVVHRPAADGSHEAASDDAPVAHHPPTLCLRRLPDEVLGAGRTRFSGLVHELGIPAWSLARQAVALGRLEWPEESGGQEALADILERCHRLLTHTTECPNEPEPYDGDAVLRRLVAPEIARQQRGMVAAMERVCSLVMTRQG